ncbi:MAG: hypothetical protein R3D26_10750 [Cyanobacteriota/Melainabacteria group bacterium]
MKEKGRGGIRVDPRDHQSSHYHRQDLDDIKDILSGLDEKNRSMAIQDYQLKYGSLRADLFELIKLEPEKRIRISDLNCRVVDG